MRKKTEVYPLDFQAIKKGDSIGASRIERITGCVAGSQKYQLAALALRERIMTERPEVVATISGHDIRILTDEEATDYIDRTNQQRLRSIGRYNRRLVQVDTTGFDSDLRRKHERRVIVNSAMYLAAVQARRREVSLSPHARSIPGKRK